MKQLLGVIIIGGLMLGLLLLVPVALLYNLCAGARTQTRRSTTPGMYP